MGSHWSWHFPYPIWGAKWPSTLTLWDSFKIQWFSRYVQCLSAHSVRPWNANSTAAQLVIKDLSCQSWRASLTDHAATVVWWTLRPCRWRLLLGCSTLNARVDKVCRCGGFDATAQGVGGCSTRQVEPFHFAGATLGSAYDLQLPLGGVVAHPPGSGLLYNSKNSEKIPNKLQSYMYYMHYVTMYIYDLMMLLWLLLQLVTSPPVSLMREDTHRGLPSRCWWAGDTTTRGSAAGRWTASGNGPKTMEMGSLVKWLYDVPSTDAPSYQRKKGKCGGPKLSHSTGLEICWKESCCWFF